MHDERRFSGVATTRQPSEDGEVSGNVLLNFLSQNDNLIQSRQLGLSCTITLAFPMCSSHTARAATCLLRVIEADVFGDRVGLQQECKYRQGVRPRVERAEQRRLRGRRKSISAACGSSETAKGVIGMGCLVKVVRKAYHRRISKETAMFLER